MVLFQRRDRWAEGARARTPWLKKVPREVWNMIVNMMDGYLMEGGKQSREFKAESKMARDMHTRAMLLRT